MFRSKHPNVEISMPRKALEAIFDECDRHNVDETGGRIIGMYKKNGREYHIDVLGVIGPGPNARRSPTSFFQDGEYQERVFREIEKDHPNLEHLGNWHTHHVNGLQSLSGGDRETYHATVNHHNHNTDFFYALLVTRKTSHHQRRYETKHFVFFRGDNTIHELNESQIQIVDKPHVGNGDATFSVPDLPQGRSEPPAQEERVRDQAVFSEFYPTLQPGFSEKLGAFFWKGEVHLVDNSSAEVLVLESTADDGPAYSITIKNPREAEAKVLPHYRDRTFRSARQAVWHLHQDVNQELHRHAKELKHEHHHG
jgi:hypothetical protein